MCELLGLSSSKAISTCAYLSEFAARGGGTADNPDGWGVAYRGRRRLTVEKDTGRASESVRMAALGRSLHSDLVIAHVRKANPPTALTLENTHPFLRGCCGRQWAFAHNGKVEAILHPRSCCQPRDCRFSGATDSEQTFCYLLQEIARVMPDAADPVDERWFTAVAAASALVAAHGQFNFLLSDGVYLLAHAHDRLHGATLDRAGVSMVAVASEPLAAVDHWESLGPNRLSVYRKGHCLTTLSTVQSVTDGDPAHQQSSDAVCRNRTL